MSYDIDCMDLYEDADLMYADDDLLALSDREAWEDEMMERHGYPETFEGDDDERFDDDEPWDDRYGDR